jgi:exonuclease III
LAPLDWSVFSQVRSEVVVLPLVNERRKYLWDYTQPRLPRREGMRIDFVLGSSAFASRVTNALIDREERKGKGASDHAPVAAELTD